MAAHVAALAVCAAALATSVSLARPSSNAETSRSPAPVCDQIAGEDTLERPARIVCLWLPVEYRGLSVIQAAIDEEPTPGTFIKSKNQSDIDQIRGFDSLFYIGCGLLCVSLYGLRLNQGRTRHRPGARKSVHRLRMMA